MSTTTDSENRDLQLPRSWSPMRWLVGLLLPFLGLFAVVIFFAASEFVMGAVNSDLSWGEFAESYESRFLSTRNFQNISVQTATIAVAALGMTLIIIAGGIDLSAGTALALVATVVAMLLRDDYFGIAAILGLPAWIGAPTIVFLSLTTGILTGVAAGWINGTLISVLRVVPFIVTLGTMTAYLGLAKWLARETTVRPDVNTQVPDWIPAMVRPLPSFEWPFVPTGVWLLLVLAIGLAVVLRFSVFGRYVFALGSNEATARLCGINVPRVKIWVYALSGFFVGVAGLLQFARLTSGNPTSGTGMELRIIAAVVIGGGSLSGGRGSVLGTLAGAAIMMVINNGCTMLGLSNSIQDIILGVIIVAAVTLDQWRQSRLGE